VVNQGNKIYFLKYLPLLYKHNRLNVRRGFFFRRILRQETFQDKVFIEFSMDGENEEDDLVKN